MVKLYVMKIKDGTFEYRNIPSLWKSKVLAEFKRQVADGEITEEEFERYTGEKYSE